MKSVVKNPKAITNWAIMADSSLICLLNGPNLTEKLFGIRKDRLNSMKCPERCLVQKQKVQQTDG